MADWLLRVLKGALIGTGAILPGISGGVLMVVLKVYRPIMEFLAHPFAKMKSSLAFLLPILVGFVIGVIGLSKVVDFLFRTSEIPAIWLFIGLVVGTLPSLYQEAGLQGRPKKAWAAFVVSALAMGGWMFFLSRASSLQAEPNTFWWCLCGFLWAIGLLVPGLSPSSFFIFFGLYQPMTAGISSLDFSVLLPMGAGLIVTVLLLAKGMNALLSRAYPVVMHAILGIVVASTVAILPLQAGASFGDIALYAACFLIGCAIALGMGAVSKKVEAENQ